MKTLTYKEKIICKKTTILSSVTRSSSANSSSDTLYAEVDTTPQRWPLICMIKDSMIQLTVLNLLKDNLLLGEADRRSLFASIFDECIKYT